MRWIIAVLLGVFLLSPPTLGRDLPIAPVLEADLLELDWYTDYAKAYEQAKTEGKYLLIFWEVPGAKFSEAVLHELERAELDWLTGRCIYLRLSYKEEKLAVAQKVRGYPTIIVAGPVTGQDSAPLLYQLAGYVKANVLDGTLRGIIIPRRQNRVIQSIPRETVPPVSRGCCPGGNCGGRPG